MNVLSIWWGYCSGAALFREDDAGGVVMLGASSEERFTRVKNTSAFPFAAIEWLRSLLPAGDGIDSIVFSSNDVGVDYLLADKGTWSVVDYTKENIEYWSKVLLDGKDLDYLQYLKQRLNRHVWPGEDYWTSLGVGVGATTKRINLNFQGSISPLLAKTFHIERTKVSRVDHHASHRHYAISTHPELPRETLVFTVDGWGDGRNATVAVVKRCNDEFEIQEIFSSAKCSLARTYRFITLLLGMKPSEHEFKVMGLASYGKRQYFESALNVFRRSLHFSRDQEDFVLNPEFKDSYFTFRDLLIGERFDNIAAGVQEWLEEVLVDWVSHFVEKTGVRDIAFSGGVAMNCKAMGVLGTAEWVRSLHVPPSSGDESHIFGAYFAHRYNVSRAVISRPEITYSGYRSNGADLSLTHLAQANPYVEQVSAVKIAELLAQGSIVAVARGRAEFGARALGNRSFLVDASNSSAKEKLNLAVKNRDFWMPFAPVILEKYASIYLSDFDSSPLRNNRFMTVVFETTEIGAQHMRSAVHPADGTCRAQILQKVDNEFLYSVLTEYENITGRGALLNTSFNTHGFPIVNTPNEAIQIFLETPTDVLVLDDIMLRKR